MEGGREGRESSNQGDPERSTEIEIKLERRHNKRERGMGLGGKIKGSEFVRGIGMGGKRDKEMERREVSL